jgi:hypothetical protein
VDTRHRIPVVSSLEMRSSFDRSGVFSTSEGKKALRSISLLERLLFRGLVEWQFRRALNIDEQVAKYGLVGTVRLRTAMVWWAVEIIVVWVAIVTTVSGPRQVNAGAWILLAMVFFQGMYRVATASHSGRVWRKANRSR